MYINTKTKEMIELSVYNALNVNREELDSLLETCYEMFQKDHKVLFLDDLYDYFFDYVKKHLCIDIDKVLFIHISRRLCYDCDDNGYDLMSILTKENSLSCFLKKYGITFKYVRHIKMYIHNQEVRLDHENYVDHYLRQRFGYQYQDFSIKGFMFGDMIDIQEYEESPEILCYLNNYVDIMDDFIKNSELYLYEYIVPIEEVYFENYEDLSIRDKQYHILSKALQRLYFYRYDPDFLEEDEMNIGLYDNCILKAEYLLKKEKYDD